MPAQILHTLFGEAVCAGLSTRLPLKLRGLDRWVFALGCQGPDIFYHSQMRRPAALEYGTLLHRRGFGTFTARLLNRALSSAGIAVLTYALGFMTHALLDRFCHPYIVYKSDPAGETPETAARFARVFRRNTAHAFFERILDVLMLAFLRGTAATSWDQRALAAVCRVPPVGIKELLADTLREVFPERAGTDEKVCSRIDNAFADSAAFYCITAPQTTALYRYLKLKRDSPLRELSLAYLYPERLPLHIDYLNLARRTWFYPTTAGAEDTRSFLDIYDAAVQAGIDTVSSVLTPYWETGIFPQEPAARRLGNGGLSIQDETGRPCPAVKTGVLPLDEVLLRQNALRTEATTPGV